MKIKYFIITFLCILSFYYTERIALYVKSKHPLVQKIESNKDELYVNSIDSKVVDELYIIPGLNGKEVNVNSSFNVMKPSNTYDESQIVYNQIKPNISLEDNKDKIIIRGNPKKNNVSLIFESENELTKYLKNNDYYINVLIKKEEYLKGVEMINNSTSLSTYNNIDNYLNNNKLNKNLCYITNKKFCKDKYIFKESLIINHSNISKNINNITPGEIILVNNTLTLSELILLINKIESQQLKIVPLSTLISEIN